MNYKTAKRELVLLKKQIVNSPIYVTRKVFDAIFPSKLSEKDKEQLFEIFNSVLHQKYQNQKYQKYQGMTQNIIEQFKDITFLSNVLKEISMNKDGKQFIEPIQKNAKQMYLEYKYNKNNSDIKKIFEMQSNRKLYTIKYKPPLRYGIRYGNSLRVKPSYMDIKGIKRGRSRMSINPLKDIDKKHRTLIYF
jgi:hypothetical protein